MNLKTKNKKIRFLQYVNLKKIFYGLIGVLIIGLLTLVISWGGRAYIGKLNEGDISVRSVYSPFSFTTRGSVNLEATEDLRDKAEGEVKDIYILDDSYRKNALEKIKDYFSSLESFTKQEFDEVSKIKDSFNRAFQLNLKENDIKALVEYSNLERLEKISKEIINDVFSRGVISKSLKDQLNNQNIEQVLLRAKDKDKDKEILVSSFVIDADVRVVLFKLFSDHFPDNLNVSEALSKLVSNLIVVNVNFDRELTQEKKKIARSKVSPVYNTISVKRNELIVERGARLNRDQIRILEAINQIEIQKNRFWYMMGTAGILVVFTLIFLIFLYYYQKKMFNGHDLLMISLFSFILTGVARGITISPLSSYLIPVASISMLAMILFNFQIAVLLTVMLSLISGIIVGDGLSITIMFFIGGIFSIFILNKVKKRIKILQAGLGVGVVQFIAVLFLGWLQNVDYNTVLTQGAWGMGSGLFSAMLAMAFLPIFEHVFNITTDISLLEQSDLNHPLLKEMIIKAPGTYHHSLIVGNLSEAACESIGANALLARIGSYFHDIGKIEKAEYFSENQIESKSKHDKLTPDMSKLIIIKHVKEGIDLAKKYKLKSSIIDFIAQHHGTGLVFYFFKRALDENADDTDIDEEYYRYSGPKPQSKETAVVLLADSVEAATRALSNPTPSRIKGLVRKVINNKFIDGQLDECDLTLKELEKIASVFIRILLGVFHSRIEYPEKSKEESEKPRE